jgi:hypothetical protein
MCLQLLCYMYTVIQCHSHRCCHVSAGACWSSPEPGGGRLLVLGAAGLFDDAWLDKEDNSRLSDFVFKWLRPVSTKPQQLHPNRQPREYFWMTASSACKQQRCSKHGTCLGNTHHQQLLVYMRLKLCSAWARPHASCCFYVPALYEQRIPACRPAGLQGVPACC